MPRAPRLTADTLLRALRRDGWTEVRRRGSHAVLAHPTKQGRPVVPVHSGETLPPGTLAAILKDCELSIDQLRRLL
jgi:predicted RNA binding protein YcfA (HicA-like mRNA interferase family)